MTEGSFLTNDARTTAGVLLLTITAVEYGGWFMLRAVRGKHAATPFQMAFFRAGHAHAGVFVILALVGQILVSGTKLPGLWGFLATTAIPAAAVLVPAGFFLSAAGRQRMTPNGFIALIYVGMLVLGAGVVALGIGLLAG